MNLRGLHVDVSSAGFRVIVSTWHTERYGPCLRLEVSCEKDGFRFERGEWPIEATPVVAAVLRRVDAACEGNCLLGGPR